MKGLLAALLVLSLAALPAGADVLVTWDGNGPDGDGSATADNFQGVVGAGATAGAAANSDGTGLNNDNLGPTPKLMGSDDPTNTTPTATNYIAFEVQADLGYTLDITSFSWQMSSRPTGGNGSYGATDYSLRYVVGGGGEVTLATGSVYAASFSGLGHAGGQYSESLSLTGVSDPVEFRLYLWGGNLGEGDAAWQTLTYFDNVQVEGSAVPEPLTLSLLAAGGLAVLKRR